MGSKQDQIWQLSQNGSKWYNMCQIGKNALNGLKRSNLVRGRKVKTCENKWRKCGEGGEGKQVDTSQSKLKQVETTQNQ